MDVASPMEPIVNTDSSETGDTHSHDASGRAGKPNDTSRGSGVSNVSGGELKTAISAVTAQLTQQLHEVGSHLSGIESAHRALMERLQHIAEQADDRALHQFSSLQEQIEDARIKISSAQEDHDVVRESFLDQFQVIRDQYEGTRQQFGTTEQRFKEVEQRIHVVADGVQAGDEKNVAMEQRLSAAEQKQLDAERNWQRTDDWLQTTRNQLESVEQQLQTTVQQLQEFQQQLTDADGRIKSSGQQLQDVQQRLTDADVLMKSFGQQLQDVQQRVTDADVLIKSFWPEMKSCEERLERNTQSQFSEITKIVDEHVLRRQNLQIAFGEIVEDINQLKTYLPRLTGSDEQIANLHAMFRSSRRMQRFAVAVSIVSLFTAVYIGMGKPGWPTIAHYLSLWLPG
jgi:predicted  nucleic acid-binding Zn-ribbon protein